MKRILTSLALIAAGALAAFPSFATVATGTVSPLYYSADTGNTYRAYYSERGITNAAQGCTNKGGHLVVINSQAEYADTVEPLISLDTTHDYWMGATLTSAGVTTVTGQPLATLGYPYPVLSSGFPDGLTRYLDYSQTSQFWNWSLNAQDHYWICEFEHAPI